MAKNYWEPTAEDEIREQVRRCKRLARQDLVQEFQLAIDYMNGRQRDDTIQELTYRYPSSMDGDPGQQMMPITIPLTEKYVDEMATLYDHPLTRTIQWEDGTEDDTTRKITDEYKKHLDKCTYDETMHHLERIVCVIKSSVLWHSYKRNTIHAKCIYPHDLYAVIDDSHGPIDPADPCDYAGFVAQLYYGESDSSFAQKQTYAMITPQYTSTYTASEPNGRREDEMITPNPFHWPQIPHDKMTTKNAPMVDSPILPLSFWHRVKPETGIIFDADPDIVYANRELNIAWSAIMDTIRFQGFDTAIKTLANPGDPKAQQKHGARFPVILGLGESFSYSGSSAPYGQIIDSLKAFVRTVATMKGLSPNDLAIDGSSPISGFAKLIDSLPKIGLRNDFIRRMKASEEMHAWPINAAILRWAGVFPPSVVKMKCVVKYSDIEFPETQDERARRLEVSFAHGLSSPVREYMQLHGVGEDDAIEAVERNKGESGRKAEQESAEPSMNDNPSSMIGRLIGMRKSVKPRGEE